MNKDELFQRLSKLLENELKLTCRENTIARRSAKMFYQADTVFDEVKLHMNVLELLQEKIKEARDENERLENIRQAELKRLQDTETCIAQMEAVIEKTTKEFLIKKQKDQELKAKLRDLKHTSNTYIKLQALPQRIQGVVLCEKSDSTAWQPIDIDVSQTDRQEIKNKIWQGTDSVSDEHQRAWERIFLSTSNEENKENKA